MSMIKFTLKLLLACLVVTVVLWHYHSRASYGMLALSGLVLMELCFMIYSDRMIRGYDDSAANQPQAH